MAQCVLCNQFFPPGFTELTNDGQARKCIFCIREKDYIEYWDDEEQTMKTATKKEIVNDYKKLIKKIEERRNVQDLIFSPVDKSGGE